MSLSKLIPTLIAFPALLLSAPAMAQQSAKTDARRLTVAPIADGRARYEHIEQGSLDADALTVRVRAGAEATMGSFSLLAEAEATVAAVNSYNAFPFAVPGEDQRRPKYAVVPDPRNIELNRLQLQYKLRDGAVTIGRQRINLDDQRWVGSVGWRQNEQTFDAVRAEARLGRVAADVTSAVSQRTIFGSDAGPRTAYDGDFLFAGVSSKLDAVDAKLFSYLLDYDETFFLTNSSQTYGGTVSATLHPAGRQLALRLSYARQSDFGQNPFDYAADYWSLEGATSVAGFTITAGWERLGSDNGHAVQTPMATLHKFNGWADLFLTTPPAGLEDAYLSIGRKFTGVKLLPGLNANVTFHQFDSARGGVEYGTEWDASIGFKLRNVGLLLKYAAYRAQAFGSNTKKLWLQAEWGL